jgi:ATPase subunit of ABC transporter with duplicated ATPase domains
MLSRAMLAGPNLLMLDEPTNHLDLESITALNNALIDFPGMVIMTTYDQKLRESVTNRVIKI